MDKHLGCVGALTTLLSLFTGSFVGGLAPYGMNESHPLDPMGQPSARYWLGTDDLGRDMLSRVIFGARISVIVGLAATALSTLIGTSLGMLSGYIGGKFDLAVQRFVDAWMSLPGLPVLMIVIALVGPGMMSLILALGVLTGITGSRFARSVVISIKENVYIEAARSIGSPTSRILIRHILPNILPPVIIVFSMTVPGIILTEASLSFLAFGIPPPAPSW